MRSIKWKQNGTFNKEVFSFSRRFLGVGIIELKVMQNKKKDFSPIFDLLIVIKSLLIWARLLSKIYHRLRFRKKNQNFILIFLFKKAVFLFTIVISVDALRQKERRMLKQVGIW